MRVFLRTKVGWKSQSLKNFESSKNANVYTFEGLAYLIEKKTNRSAWSIVRFFHVADEEKEKISKIWNQSKKFQIL